jgi:hypothetical protein
MRRALRGSSKNKGQTAISVSMPAPIGGWNAREALANMPATDAVYLKNIIPRTGYCETRKGVVEWVDGMTGTVQTIMPYNNATSNDSALFAVTPSGIYDVTVNGTSAGPDFVVTEPRMEYEQITTPGGQYLVAVNGEDNLSLYDGSSWSFVTGVSAPIAITNIDTAELDNVCKFAERLFFSEKNSLSLWYLPVQSVGGAAVEFPLGSVFSRGGSIADFLSWTIDSGSGMDDYFVVMSTEGEIVVYRGTDPSDATQWAKVGLFYIGTPLGKRCLLKYGGDVLVLTKRGAYPLSKALLSSTLKKEVAITDKIIGAFTTATQLYGDFFGWEALVYPEESLLLINVPISPLSLAEQYVMNTSTGAWCSFTGWNAVCWGYFNGEIYFGANGTVSKAYNSFTDYDAIVPVDAKSAYNYFKTVGKNKHWTLLRPTFAATNDFSTAVSIETEFSSNLLAGSPSTTALPTDEWDSGLWDTALWGGAETITNKWVSPASKVGYCAATRIKIASEESQVKWIATDYIYTIGGPL